jgi:hypothetical protein
MSLPPIDEALNLRLIAERLHWPDGAADACLNLEADYPRWTVFWTRGGLPLSPERGYRAFAEVRKQRGAAFGETPEALREALAVADAQLPDNSWL